MLREEIYNITWNFHWRFSWFAMVWHSDLHPTLQTIYHCQSGFRPWSYIPRVEHEFVIPPEQSSSPSVFSGFVWLLFIVFCDLFCRPLFPGCPFLVAMCGMSVHRITDYYYLFNICKLFLFSCACPCMIFVFSCALFGRPLFLWLFFSLYVWLVYEMSVWRITGFNYPVDISKSMKQIARHDMPFLKCYWKLC